MIEPDPEQVSRELAQWRDEHPPRVSVVQQRRWYWYLVLFDGDMEQGHWFVLGSAERADRVARRKLAAYLRRQQHRTRWEVTAP